MTIDDLVDRFVKPAMDLYAKTGVKPELTVKLPKESFERLWWEWASRCVFRPPPSIAFMPLRFRVHHMLSVEEA